MAYKQLTSLQISTINTIYRSNKIIRDCERRMAEDEYMFDEYIDMMIDRARGQD